MSKALVGFCALIIVVLFMAVRAFGQQPPTPPCKPYGSLVAELNGTYGEIKVATDTVPTSRMELWLSPARSWTLVVVMPNDMACMIAAGKNLQFTKPPTTDKDT